MWWKKLLYYLLVTVLGIGITTLSASICFSVLSKDIVKTAVKEGKYTYAESFFNYVSVNDENKFYSNKFENTTIEVYPCLIKQPYYRHDDKSGYVLAYDVVEEAIGITLFNIPDTFKLEDVNDTKGFARLSVDNNSLLDLYFDNSKSEDETNINHRINFYSYFEEYGSLTVYVTYSDFLAKTGSDNLNINKIEIFDGTGTSFFNVEGLNNVNFHHFLNGDYHEVCMAYREYMMQYGEGKSVTTFERKAALLKAIEDVTTTHPDKYVPKPEKTVVLKEDAFILTVALTLSIYIALTVFVTGVIFYRKK